MLVAYFAAFELGGLSTYLVLGLLLIILITCLRVRFSRAYNQTPTQIVERPPGARTLDAPRPALPEALEDLDFALLSQAAYDETPYAKKQPTPLRDVKDDLAKQGWSICKKIGQSDGLQEKLDKAHLRAQVWINVSKSEVAATFGGTVVGNDKDWISNLRWFTPFHNDEYTKTVKVFGPAFCKVFVEHIREKLADPKSVKIYSTGHSLGGGLAQQFAYSLPLDNDVPRVHKVFAFDPSPVTGYFSVKRSVRTRNRTGLLIDRIYERGEILAYVRSITNFFWKPSAINAAIRQVRYNLFYTVQPFAGHSIAELAEKLWDLVNSPANVGRVIGEWRRPKIVFRSKPAVTGKQGPQVTSTLKSSP